MDVIHPTHGTYKGEKTVQLVRQNPKVLSMRAFEERELHELPPRRWPPLHRLRQEQVRVVCVPPSPQRGWLLPLPWQQTPPQLLSDAMWSSREPLSKVKLMRVARQGLLPEPSSFLETFKKVPETRL